MKKLFVFTIVLSIICFTTSISYSQPYWAKTYGEGGGDPHEGEIAFSIQQTTDEGSVFAGVTGGSFQEPWIVKLNRIGNVTWQKTYGGGSLGGQAFSIQQTTDGGYIVAGVDEYAFLIGDIWVRKLDSSGGVTWQNIYISEEDDSVNAIQETTDGGYIVAAETRSFGAGFYDIWIMKLDSSGNVSWQKAYGGSEADHVSSIQQTSDGGYIVAGRTASFGAGFYDIWIMKLDSSGNFIWQKTYGEGSELSYSIQQTTDNGYVIAGRTSSFGAGDWDVWIIKLNSNGIVTWQKAYGGSGYDSSHSIQQTTDGGYVLVGKTDSFGAGDDDVWVIKLNSSGDFIWQKTYGGSGLNDVGRSIEQTTDGGYIVAGETQSFGAGDRDAFVLRLDSNGEIPYCDIMKTSNATITNTTVSALGQDTSATITDTSATIEDITVASTDSSARTTTVCGDNAIPTLSEWGLIIFMTLILGISIVMLYKRREI